MEQLLFYGNIIFWIGLLLAVFLAACEFFLNDIEKSFAHFHMLTFAEHPRMQKICRALYVVTLLLVLFAEVGEYWRSQSFSFWNWFANEMIVLFIYFVVCYSAVICFLWTTSILLKMFKLLIAGLVWLCKDTFTWISAG